MASSFGFDLRMLEVFMIAVETGNLTTTAERLGTTQSSVSQTLANLEQNLAVRLLDRTVRPLRVTTEGRFLYDRASHLLAEARKTNRDILKGQFQQLHTVRIALVDSLATAVGRHLIDAVRRRTEDWSITTGLSHMHAPALLSRQVDIIISDDALDDHDDLARHPILREPFVLVLPPDFEGDVMSLARLQARHEFVRYPAHSLIGQTIERYLRHQRVELPRRLHLDNTFAIIATVAAGVGWAITTPLCLYQSGLQGRSVVCRPLPGQPLFRQLTLVSRRNELWDLPRVIAEDSCEILRERFLADVAGSLPWVASLIHVGEPGQR